MASRTDERRAIVIGGTHGIGLAIAEQLVHAGAQVVITGRDPSKARAAEARLGSAGSALVGDVADLDHLVSLAAQVGDVDALFVNVGIAEPEPLADVTEASWDRQFDVNAKGAFFTAQQLAPRVRLGGGIVFTTLTAKTAAGDEAVYAATKAAVRAFSRSLAADQVRRGVRVNTVAPGFIDTPTLGVAGPPRASAQTLGAAAGRSRRWGGSGLPPRSRAPRSSWRSKRRSRRGASCRSTAACRRSKCRRDAVPRHVRRAETTK
jgi:NAD(P)-dependent dehydrogenase (short-subunit alcohol dehydrogenase family)